MELGTWADWVNAFGTYLAVAGALFAGVVALRSYRAQQAVTGRQIALQSDEDRKRQVRERQAQANKVAIWAFRGRFNWLVHGVNESGLPVFRLTVHVFSDNSHISVAIERGTQGPAVAGKSNKLTNALQVFLEERNALDIDPNELKVEIAFTDTAGVRWHRLYDGSLVEVPESFDFEDADARLIDRLVPMRDDSGSQGII